MAGGGGGDDARADAKRGAWMQLFSQWMQGEGETGTAPMVQTAAALARIVDALYADDPMRALAALDPKDGDARPAKPARKDPERRDGKRDKDRRRNK